MHIFYKFVVESIIYSAIICWDSSIRARDLKMLNNLKKKSGSVLGTTVELLEMLIMERRILHQIKNMNVMDTLRSSS